MEIPYPHVCENTKLLTDIQIQLATNAEKMDLISNNIKEWKASQDEHNKDIKEIVARHETEISDIKHNCRFPKRWDGVWDRIDKLEKDLDQRTGAGKWEERIYKYIEYAICAILGAFIMWWMGGGKFS